MNDRILGYDLGRALALAGMVAISFWDLAGEKDSPEWFYIFIQTIMGRPAVMFVMLAGVGLYLLSKSAYTSQDATRIAENRKTLMKRALFLFVIGMLNTLIWPWDILHFYAVYFLIGAYLLIASNRRFWAIIISAVVVFSLFMLLTDFERNEDWDSIGPQDLWHVPGVLYHFFFAGLYPVFPWIGFLFIGVWLGRKDLTEPRFRRKILIASLVAVLITEAASEIFFQMSPSEWRLRRLVGLEPWFDIDPWEPMPLFFVSGAGSAIIGISLCIVLAEKLKNAKWLLPFVVMGQTTLTLYVAHTLLGAVIVWFMNYLELETELFPAWGTLVYLAGALYFCRWWNKVYKRGPLELVMGRYLALPMRLTVTGTPPADLTKEA
ncbi:MAG: DUF1624 domain-containing protein [Deltaproteobacteria bacterium]|nr:DUF1624 domain-containing protein [Deltaproteobacteria bacterium]